MRNPLSTEVRREKLRGQVLDIRRQTALNPSAIGRLARLYDRIITTPPDHVAAQQHYEYEGRKVMCIGGIAFKAQGASLHVDLRRSTCYHGRYGVRDDEMSLFLRDETQGRVRLRMYASHNHANSAYWSSEGSVAPAQGGMATKDPRLAHLPGVAHVVGRVVDLAEAVCGPGYVQQPELPAAEPLQP